MEIEKVLKKEFEELISSGFIEEKISENLKELLMIDIETMGIESDACILSIGAVFFNKDGLYNEFYEKIQLQSCLDLGLSVTASTIFWWMGQSKESKKELENNEIQKHIKEVLNNFSFFINSSISDLNLLGLSIWANGPQFDISILENAYRKAKLKIPWNYYQIRDFRTFRETNELPENLPKNRVAHNSLEDAKWQAEYMIGVMNKK